MSFDFDERLDRRASGAEKWDEEVLMRNYGRADLLPLWVADMDFRPPPAVAQALQECANVGEFGYQVETPDVRIAVAEWFRQRHDWRGLDPADLVAVPSVMSGIALAIHILSALGDNVIIQTPVFFEFASCIREAGRRIVENPLRLTDGRYEMDFEDLEAKASDPKTNLLILCNPHNPVGRAWTAEETERLAGICRKHGVQILSDDIHCDLVYPHARYVPVATHDERVSTFFSPAKSFNVGGATSAFLHSVDPFFRTPMAGALRPFRLPTRNTISEAVTKAVYLEGGPWLDAMMAYVTANLDYARQRIAGIRGVELIEPDATFLLWLDLRGAGASVRDLLVDRARLALSMGEAFGTGGEGFARMCIACPRSILAEAFDRLEQALRG